MKEQILYRFVKLDLSQFAVFDNEYVEDDRPLEVSSSFSFSYSFDDAVVCCTTTVIMAKEASPVLKAQLDSYFNIAPASVASMLEDECVVLRKDLMAQFASLGYGSMRGIIYAKTMGTPLGRIILPPNDIQEIFTAPVRFQRNTQA